MQKISVKNTINSVSLWIILAIITLAVEKCESTDNRIVGGRPAEEGEFPYQVSLRRTYNDKHFCGGSLITENHVLTAAHCMFYRWGGVLPPIVVSVVAGQLNLTIKADTVFRNVSQIIVHPEFNKTSMENDVAILKLSDSFPLTHLISTIPLAKEDNHHKECVVSGWGVQQFESTEVSETLLTTTVDRITNELCDSMYGYDTIMPSMMCAYDEEGEHDACQGDSGGPLVTSGVLIGVISTGEGCASKDYPGIYASVPYLYDWVMEIVKKTNYTEPEPESSSSPDFTEEPLSEPAQMFTESSNGSNHTINNATNSLPTNSTTDFSKNHSNSTQNVNGTTGTTAKVLNENTTSNINNSLINNQNNDTNETKPNLGDHSRIPDDIDDNDHRSNGVRKMFPSIAGNLLVLMTICMVQINVYL